MSMLEHFDHEDKKQAKDHFLNLLQVAMADGVIDQTESDMLHKFGRKMGFSESEIDALIASSSTITINPPYEFDKRFEQVYDIIKMVLADGVIDENEMRLANGFALKTGFTESEIPGLLDMLIVGIQDGKDEEELFEIYRKRRK
jgi:uncharacterized tellurite resistance protein B-like protein